MDSFTGWAQQGSSGSTKSGFLDSFFSSSVWCSENLQTSALGVESLVWFFSVYGKQTKMDRHKLLGAIFNANLVGGAVLSQELTGQISSKEKAQTA